VRLFRPFLKQGRVNMKKKQKKSLLPHYTLPGDENLDVQCMAYAHGLNILPRMLFEQLPQGAALPDTFQTNMPRDAETIAKVAQDLSETLLSGPERQFTTNSPALFRELYTTGFVEGYRFGLYAVSHGLVEWSYALPPERRYDFAYRFACERIKGEPEPDSDPVMDDALEKLRTTHKRYQALN
jgi:hypothetical protein